MNKLKHIPIVFSLLFIVYCFTGCEQNEITENPVDQDLRHLDFVSAYFASSLEDGEEIPPIENPGSHTDNEEATTLLDDAFHSEGDRVDTLFFSQLASKLIPFQGIAKADYPENMPDRMTEKFIKEYPNIYRYFYKKEYSSVWEDEPGGYNFLPTDTVTKMNWDDIKFWGKNNSGYVLYALFYPYNNVLPRDASGNIDFKVEVDQTTKDALRKSNFIGAYHSSSKSGQRLKFKLYHLTSYIKVTLYIPVFKDDDTDDKGNTIRTGFPADALQSAEVRYVYNRFRINWYGGRSSDTAPITAVITDSPRENIKMYIPTAEDYKDTDGLPPIVNIRISDFVRNAADNPDLPATDKCWKITLSALIPEGQDYPIGDETYPTGQTWTDLNFLSFNFRQNIGEVPKRFVFTGLSSYGLIAGGDNLSIGQGKLQHLSLYIPRYGAQAVLLGATVKDWEQWYNDNMGLREDDPLESENQE